MQKIIISDTSCLILLDRIGELNLLNKLFGQILITVEIAHEFKKELPDWFKIETPTNLNYQRILETSVDRGEASAIALALEYQNCLLIMDDLKGRKYATQLGIKVTGTLGVIVSAKLNGLIDSVKPLLAKIKNANFWLDAELEASVLKNSGEL
ncbi:MAG: DUF3368 domain-containing protein [Cyclobacteriaceae bacterium]|nr:DUF3368 domain-containing protein [Cyclobacteriaceae bacterium]